jgi:hypothetical protein
MGTLFCGVIYLENKCSSRERKNIAKIFFPLAVKQSRTHILGWPGKKNENFGYNGNEFKEDKWEVL